MLFINMELPSLSTLTFSFGFYFVRYTPACFLVLFACNIFSPFLTKTVFTFVSETSFFWNFFPSTLLVYVFCLGKWDCYLLNHCLMSTFTPMILFFYWCLILPWSSFVYLLLYSSPWLHGYTDVSLWYV